MIKNGKNGMVHTESGKQEESQRSNPNITHSLILQISYSEFCGVILFLHNNL